MVVEWSYERVSGRETSWVPAACKVYGDGERRLRPVRFDSLTLAPCDFMKFLIPSFLLMAHSNIVFPGYCSCFHSVGIALLSVSGTEKKKKNQKKKYKKRKKQQKT